MALLSLFILIVPLTLGLLVIWLMTGNKRFGNLIWQYWLTIIGLIFVVYIIGIFTKKKKVFESDLYGHYVIYRSLYPGKQSDWQYNHFRFDITEQNEFLFYLIEKEKVIKIYKGRVDFIDGYESPRIVIIVDQPSHHIIEDNPSLFRTVWSFYYSFNSPKFGNVFFTKGVWKPID